MEGSLRDDIPLQKRKILKKTFASLIKVCIFCAIVTAFLVQWMGGDLGELPVWVAENRGGLWALWALAVILLILSRTLYQILYFITYHYDMDDKNMVIRKGVLTKREITLPFSKITDVYVDQDIADVAMGLYDVHISTPTAESGRFAHIDGLNKAGSSKLRKMLLEKVNASHGK